MSLLYASPDGRNYGSLQNAVGLGIEKYVSDIEHGERRGEGIVTLESPKIENIGYEDGYPTASGLDADSSLTGALVDITEKVGELYRGVGQYDVEAQNHVGNPLDADIALSRIMLDLIYSEGNAGEIEKEDLIDLYGSAPEERYSDPGDWGINVSRQEVVEVARKGSYTDEELEHWPVDAERFGEDAEETLLEPASADTTESVGSRLGA
jgi:hypothetical protein